MTKILDLFEPKALSELSLDELERLQERVEIAIKMHRLARHWPQENTATFRLAAAGGNFIDHHDRHCCAACGCKYGDADCPVKDGRYPGVWCEFCYDDMRDIRSWEERYSQKGAPE